MAVATGVVSATGRSFDEVKRVCVTHFFSSAGGWGTPILAGCASATESAPLAADDAEFAAATITD